MRVFGGMEKKAWFPPRRGRISPRRRTMSIEDFRISVLVGVDDTRKALWGSSKPGRGADDGAGRGVAGIRPVAGPGSASFRTWPESMGGPWGGGPGTRFPAGPASG